MDAVVQRFAIRWSLSTWVVTAGAVVVICIGLAAVLGATIHAASGAALLMVLGLEVFLLVAILAVVALLAPLGYAVTENSVIIRRLADNVVIPRAEIQDVRRLARGDVGFAWRWFGSGGFLGFFGYFSSAKLGRFRAYAADTRSLVLITRTDGSKMLISPYPPDRFVELVRESTGRQVS